MNDGLGGYSRGILSLKNETKGFLYVGGKGTANQTKGIQMGGFNGGGNGSFYDLSYTYGGGGGGASDIRLETDSFNTRIIVAGGGGGSGHGYSATDSNNFNYYNPGGCGGGDEGGNGTINSQYPQYWSYGGTQIGPGKIAEYNYYRTIAEFGYGGSCTKVQYDTSDPGVEGVGLEALLLAYGD
ncbi:hypothetical protein TVAG_401190 [Trichomonas vaginalis G3]|uniref:receptor protein-tyrosine kinase n=1 Tax=Trichomonas vaginalis (strain ATCC PRA-98 / G3) TaxID=412133 RepID=A2E3M7_TRIV3|nr:glycine-rich protein family [Trichomonas vaginalis G3]EAY12793.1 hypothetical protein TVAG_401190 [Trichomonas vaginalis G3]KAI5505583.1 glycine-rich protein family [Trichomonas vaginalis G3]|eukprot:XP_001325016.1 hypothetical protein [Trichomonas vaginalis G3]